MLLNMSITEKMKCNLGDHLMVVRDATFSPFSFFF